jgi:cytochrome-b5 reductase
LPLLQPLIDCAVTHPEHFQLDLFVNDGASKAPAPESVAKHLKVGRIDKSSIARTLGIHDGAQSWSSWISNFWTRGQPKAVHIDIRKKNVLVLVCGPEPYVLSSLPRPHVLTQAASITRMVAAIAGPYGRNYSQGKVGGVLSELGFKAGQVWKL